jgi:hypothetical protein
MHVGKQIKWLIIKKKKIVKSSCVKVVYELCKNHYSFDIEVFSYGQYKCAKIPIKVVNPNIQCEDYHN